jgi:DNA-binding transcriptional LysR family regulator
MNLKSLDLNLLVVFDRLMEARSVTAAARLLGLTQSSVSSALGRLRIVVKDRLLERHGNAMVPTHTALAIWPDIRMAITAIHETLSRLDAFDPSHHAGTFQIGMDEYTHVVLGNALLTSLRNGAPHAGIQVLPIRVPDAVDSLNAGTMDMAIGASWTTLAGLRVDRLFGDEFAGLVDIKHPTIGPSPSLEGYLSVPHLLVSSIGQVPGNVDAVLTRKGLRRRIGMTVPYLLAAPQLLAGSDMIFNTGRRLAQTFAGWYPVIPVVLPVRVPGFTVAMVWHPRNSESQAHSWLRRQVLEAARSVRRPQDVIV